jgi:hypothetical protein
LASPVGPGAESLSAAKSAGNSGKNSGFWVSALRPGGIRFKKAKRSSRLSESSAANGTADFFAITAASLAEQVDAARSSAHGRSRRGARPRRALDRRGDPD